MKKAFFKKITVFFWVFIMLFSSFAAVVTDNDGAAFITKAEFDTLRNNFQGQIDLYNQSIDSKIDEAIASYLSGVVLKKKNTDNILFNSYETVTAMNGSIAPEFRYPDIDINIFYTVRWNRINSAEASGTERNGKLLAGIVKVKYPKTTKTWGATETNRRALVTNNKENGEQTDNMVWNGVALRYKESYTCSRGYQQHSDMAYMDRPDTYVFTTNFFNPCALRMNGYLANFYSETTSVLNPTFQYGYKTTSASSYTYVNKTFTENKTNNLANEVPICTNTDVVELVEMNGKTKEYEHIIQWDKNTSWTVSNNDFLNTFRQHTSNSYKSQGLYNSSDTEKVNKMDCVGMIMNGYDATSKAYINPRGYGWMTLNGITSVSDNTNLILPSIGMLKDNQPASKILQHSMNKVVANGGTTVSLTPASLEAGLQLLGAKKGTEITWDVEFGKADYYTGSVWDDSKIQTIMVEFSMAPFTDKNTTTTGKKINVKVGTNATLKTYAEVINKKERIKWIMPEDGIVYVKWYPKEVSGTVNINNNWRIDLDVSKSGQFVYEMNE